MTVRSNAGAEVMARETIAASDAAIGSIAVNSGINATRYSNAVIYFSVTGSGTFDFTPLYYSVIHGKYMQGEPQVGIDGDRILEINTDSSPDVFFHISNFSGFTNLDISYKLVDRAGVGS